MAQSQPALVVGIGGSGVHLLMQLRNSLFNEYGTVSPNQGIQYLYIDLKHDDISHVLDHGTKNLEFRPDEKLLLNLPIRTLEALGHYLPSSIPAIMAGASSSRIVGKAVALMNADILKSVLAVKLNLLNAADDIHALIISSLAGGTGSGMLLDVAAQIRATRSQNIRIVGYLIGSSFFDTPMNNSLAENMHSTLRELEEVKRNQRYGSSPYSIIGNLFDDIYLIDNEAAPFGSNLSQNRSEIFKTTARLIAADITGSIRADLPTPYMRRLYEEPGQNQILQVQNHLIIVNEEILDHLKQHPEILYELHPRKFEEVVAAIWENLGYKVTLTQKSRDGGKDIYAVQHTLAGDLLYIIECKRYSPDRPVGVEIVRALYGVSQHERATMGVVATTSYFTKAAQQFQRRVKYQLSLRDYNSLSDWLKQLRKG